MMRNNLPTCLLTAGIGLGALLMAPGQAHAATMTVSFSDAVLPAQTTNFTETLTLQKFDSTLGTLLSVKFQLDGLVEGNIRVESLDASSSTVTANLSATLSLTGGPTNGVLVDTIPLASETRNLSAYDGAIDFAGTSGFAVIGATASDSDSATFVDQPFLDFFTGLGTVDLSLVALGQSNSSGAGNVVNQFATRAGGTATVVYTYETDDVETVPEPMGLLGSVVFLGLVATGARNRFRHS